jgi:enoyl-CoA hydratase/carnithine racemase
MLSQRTEDDILILTLDNGKDNSLTAEFYTTMRYLIKKVNSAPSPKGIILTGQGRFFSSGFNLPMFLGFKDVKEVAASSGTWRSLCCWTSSRAPSPSWRR